MASFVAGKALLVIYRDDAERFWITVHVQHVTHSSTSRAGALEWVREEFGLMEWDVRALPGCTRRMAVGDTMRVAVTFNIEGWASGWDGEGDSSLELIKSRCLRHQKCKN